MIEIRAERPGEASAIEQIHIQAFGQPVEAQLVRRLRAGGFNVVSLVAADEGNLVGHVLFSRLSAPGLEAVSLAPVSVLPERQRQGIGSSLIRKGLEACRSASVDAVVVVGEPAYYTRFGFLAETGSQFVCAYSGPYLMALELRSGAIGNGVYQVEYPGPFQDI